MWVKFSEGLVVVGGRTIRPSSLFYVARRSSGIPGVGVVMLALLLDSLGCVS
jgi:hypothetical protein